MKVPFLDLKAGYNELKADLDAAYQRVMDRGHYITGPELEAFEQEFAAYSGAAHCIGVANGLEALQLVLMAAGIGEGDEVIVPAQTFVATWLAVSLCGATPVPAASDARTYNLAPEGLKTALTARTKAIMPVHLYGQSADMDPIKAFAKEPGLLVLEDAAQSHGARYLGQSCGSLGDAAGTSFYPGKNLGAFGDGGAVLTSNESLAEKVLLLRNYGAKVKYHHEAIGLNTRLDELQAAFLRVKLTRLDEWNARRKAVAARYQAAFGALDGVITPFVPEWSDPVWHLYVVRVRNRDLFQERLKEEGIETLIHYPIPPHKQGCYATLPIKGCFDETAQIADEILSLPISPFMDEAQVDAVIQSVQKVSTGLA